MGSNLTVISAGMGPSRINSVPGLQSTEFYSGTTIFFLIRGFLTIRDSTKLTAANGYNIPAGYSLS